MIQAVGIDSVEIIRFNAWKNYSEKKLLKLFLPHEIAYCLSNSQKSAERFAVRFAAKEAFLKAFSSLTAATQPLSLLTICKNVSIKHSENNVPYLLIEWNNLIKLSPSVQTTYITHISLTHTKNTATAMVVIEGFN
jgi:phosphopantetheine--protein transferase-like protein